jgi:hypothetical protein
MSRTKAHPATMQREKGVAQVYEAVGLHEVEEEMGEKDEQAEQGEKDEEGGRGSPVKKKARRDSGSSSAGGAAERSMSQFAEVMSKFYAPPVAAAAASSSPPITAEQWLGDCMVSDEQRKALTALLPDPAKPFTLLILSSFDAATLAECGLKPFQQAAWAKLAAKLA